jgi:hypothetical protein
MRHKTARNRGEKNFQMNLVVAVIFTSLCPLMAVAQDGSVVVASWYQDEIAIAADSRGSGPHSYSDTSCKIAAFGNKLIFGAAGRSKPPDESTSFWDIYTAAFNHFVWITREGATDHLAERVASAWGEDVKIKFELAGLSSIQGLDEDGIASGIFADFEKDGTLLIVVTSVDFKESFVYPRITVNTVPLHPGDGDAFFVGKGEVITETNAAKTPRGSEWFKELHRRSDGPNTDRATEEAIAFVDLTIRNLPKMRTDFDGVPFSVVGPPISAVRLVRGKGTRWIAKGICQP